MRTSILIQFIFTITLIFSTSSLNSQIEIWTNLNDLPSERGFCASAVLDNKIYIIGGFPDSDELAITDVIAYDPIADVFITDFAPLPLRLGRVHAEILDGKIYAIGGHSANFGGNMLPSVFKYDPIADSWTQKEDMQHRRFNHSTSILDGKIIVLAGRTEDWPAEVDNSVESYDPITNTWTLLPPMNKVRAGHISETVGGKLYVLGGTDVNDVAQGIEVYDPISNQWTIINETFNRWGHGSVVRDDTIYFFAGADNVTGLPNIWKYDVVNNVLKDLDIQMPEVVAYPAHGLLKDSNGDTCIYVFGGTTTDWWLSGAGPHTTSSVVKYCFGGTSSIVLGKAAVQKLQFSVFPNPSLNKSTFQYALKNSTNVKMIIVDQSGKVIETVMNQFQKSGNYIFSWNISHLAPGTYYCKIKTDKYLATEKLIVQR